MFQLTTKNLVGTAMCIALGIILPQVFHLVGAGSVFLPMHIPILLCGLCFGMPCGLICGLITPLLSSLFTGMPPIYPIGITMCFELATYGAVSGLIYRLKNQNIYIALIGAMLVGRLVSGAVSAVLYNIAGNPYGLQTFLTASFVTGLPGIVIQIIIVPLMVIALEKGGLISNPGLSQA